MAQVRQRRRRGITRITAKNQATIPVGALRQVGLKAGDLVRIEPKGAGRIELTRVEDPILKHAGALTGVYPKNYLKKLRGEFRW